MRYSKSIILKLLLATALVSTVTGQHVKLDGDAEPPSVYPVFENGFTHSMNGDWSFKYIPALDAGADAGFHTPDFDVSAWKTLKVPANWELQGFAEPKYALELEDGLGLYQRLFRIPADWLGGRRVCLRFEGVAFGFEVWVNGRAVGASNASAYNPHTFDITDALKADAGNVLAVKVSTKPLGYEFDVNDDWSLSGIYRDVTLFSVPASHFTDLNTRTKLAADGSAELHVAVSISRQEGEVTGKLLAPDGKVVREFPLAHTSHGTHKIPIRLENPQLWTAETPSLYQLQLTLSANGQPLQTITQRIGLREISIVDGVLKLNGHPIKLRGVNHHDIEPETGRAVTEAGMRQDLELMKKGNVNFVRTSHYPPNRRLIELCDEMGFYVMDEVSIGKGEEHLNNPRYRDNILARVEPTITRDKNHPSVIIWSIGNENPIADVLLEAGRMAKEFDSSRPICFPTIGSYFEKNYERFPDFVDIYAPHYPVNTTLRRYAGNLKRPLILTEYAHALGLATDRIQDQWDILQATPKFAGASLWMFQDQGLLRKSDQPPDSNKPTEYVWLDAHRYYDTAGDKGCDGLVYSDRTPQTDYWQMRKVYAPVQIEQTSATVKPGAQEITLTVENRHDFRSLEGMKLAWSLQRNGGAIQKGEVPLLAASREKESMGIPVNIPADAAADILTLSLRCTDEKGLQFTEHTLRLNLEGDDRNTWPDSLPAGDAKVTESETEVKIEHSRWILTVAQASGELTIRDRAGHVLVSGIHPHPGRKFTMAAALLANKSDTWQGSLPTRLEAAEVKVTRDGQVVNLSVTGTYPRPQPKPEEEKIVLKKSDEPLDQAARVGGLKEVGDQSLVGGYQAEITPGGAITIRYHYVPTHATGKFSEAGLSIVLPPGMTEFRWIGQGPYAGYPGKDRLNEFGLFHLNREDLNYQGNRRETECALVTTPQGAGIAMVTNSADVAIERDGDNTLLSHNAVISSPGNKGSSPEKSINVEKTARIAGSFTLVPLDHTWPETLTRWFGKPDTAPVVFKPFHHSYDQ